MAKRLTETQKWSRPWFRSLPMEYKLLWVYICDTCDMAGIWYVDFDLASFSIGTPLDVAKAKSLFSKQITDMAGGQRWFIRDFIAFQYGILRPNNNAHRAVKNCLERQGLLAVSDEVLGASQPLTSPCPGAMDKDKEKDKDKDGSRRRKGEGPGEGEFDVLWKRYPRREGRKEALRHFLASVTTKESLQKVSSALENYCRYIRTEHIEHRFIKHGSTWFFNWEDWVDYRAVVPVPTRVSTGGVVLKPGEDPWAPK